MANKESKYNKHLQACLRFFKKPKQIGSLFIKGISTVAISILLIYGIAQAGSLTPSSSPGSTMKSLQDIWNILAGSDDTSGTVADGNGDILERLQFIQENLGGYAFGSSNSEEVLTSAGGTYDAANLIADNVRSGVVFATGTIGTYGGSGWTYGSEDAPEVLTTADAPGTYDATELFVSTTKIGVNFGDGLVGAYPSASYPLSGADSTTDLTALSGDISSSNGAVEWWQSDGTHQAAILDIPLVSNVCSSDSSNNTTGTLLITAAYVSTGNTYCGIAGTLLDGLYNGTLTAGGFDGGTQSDGGVDDYNNGGLLPGDTYSKGWTECNAGNNYCGTNDFSADAMDNSTKLIWSFPCDGTRCSSFSDASSRTYSWDDSRTNNGGPGGLTAAELCSSGDHGKTGWLLPHQKQLLQAYINGAYGNLEAIGAQRYYWSATTRSDDTNYAWRVDVSRGQSTNTGKTGANRIRCVRLGS